MMTKRQQKRYDKFYAEKKMRRLFRIHCYRTPIQRDIQKYSEVPLSKPMLIGYVRTFRFKNEVYKFDNFIEYQKVLDMINIRQYADEHKVFEPLIKQGYRRYLHPEKYDGTEFTPLLLDEREYQTLNREFQLMFEAIQVKKAWSLSNELVWMYKFKRTKSLLVSVVIPRYRRVMYVYSQEYLDQISYEKAIDNYFTNHCLYGKVSRLNRHHPDTDKRWYNSIDKKKATTKLIRKEAIEEAQSYFETLPIIT